MAVTDIRAREGVSPHAVIRPHWVWPEMAVLEDGMIVARYRGRQVPKGEPQVNTNMVITPEIGFGEASPLEGLGVEDTLQEIGMHVSDILLTFKLRFDGKL